jgi:glutathione S-transferase
VAPGLTVDGLLRMASDAVADYRVARATDSKAPRGAETDGQRAMRFAEDHLAKHPYFGGSEFTAADIMMVYCLTTSRAFRGTALADFPNLKAYLARIGARPAYQRAQARNAAELAAHPD